MNSVIDELGHHKTLLYSILFITSVLSLYLFSTIIWVIFFAVTLAYVLHPFNQKLQKKGLGETKASIITTLTSLVAIAALATPFAIVLYRRRQILIDFLRDIPETISLNIIGYDLTIPTNFVIEATRDTVTETAITLAQQTPGLLFKLILAVAVLYTLLKKPKTIEQMMLEILPDSAEQSIYNYNQKIKETLMGLYVVQLSTAILTFLIGMPVFYILGYEPFVSLALLAAILQLIPVLGPTILITSLAAFETILYGLIPGLIILIPGLLLIALLPDLVIRPSLADKTIGMSPTLYLIGFIAGILSLGAIGIIVGPLMIAIINQTIQEITQD